MLSKITSNEWGGFIYSDKYNNFHYTIAETDNEKHSIDLLNNENLKKDVPFLKDGNKIKASFHSHPESFMASNLKVYEYKDIDTQNDAKDNDDNSLLSTKLKPTYYPINTDKPESDHGQIFSNIDIASNQKDNHLAGDYMIDPSGYVHKHTLPKTQDNDKTFSYPFIGDIEIIVDKAKQ